MNFVLTLIAVFATIIFCGFLFATICSGISVLCGHTYNRKLLKQFSLITSISLLIAGISWPIIIHVDENRPVHVYEAEVVHFWGEKNMYRFTGQNKPHINNNNCVVYGNDTLAGVCSVVIKNDSIIGE